MEFKFRNVNDAFGGLVDYFVRGSTHEGRTWGDEREKAPVVKEASRNGNVLRIDEPVIITYSHPTERVLFNAARDANPFALLYEALYMLAGRNDVAPLAYYTKQFNEYSDDGETLNGSYGFRWRQARTYGFHYPTAGYLHTDVDQIDAVVNHLKTKPNSRRAVLQMWNVQDDLLQIGGVHPRRRTERKCHHCNGRGYHETGIGDDAGRGVCGVCSGRKVVEERHGDCTQCAGRGRVRRNRETGEVHGRLSYNDELTKCPRCNGTGEDPGSKDVCCNLSVLLQLRPTGHKEIDVSSYDGGPKTIKGMATRGVLDITVLNRSNDLVWGLLGANYVTFSVLQEYLAARLGVGVGRYHHISNNLHAYSWNFKPDEWLACKTPDYYSDANLSQEPRAGINVTEYWGKDFKPYPLVSDPAVFEQEVREFVHQFGGIKQAEDLADHWDEPFLADVAQPMLVAWACYKVGDFHGAFACLSGIEAPDWRVACEAWMRRRYERRQAKKEATR